MMDFLAEFELPGGDDFVDVTDVLREASEDMEPDEIILTDGFTLFDSMSAIEIGEPRMDSGMILPEEERRPLFYPMLPLLPEELCYILDRSFSVEMEWHAGYTLTQTVFTLLYVHHLVEIDPENVTFQPLIRSDPQRPLALITVVLRAAVRGLLKCCDLAWRELSRGRVYDTEDWQSEKCSVSLLEGMAVRGVLSRLEEASAWLLRHDDYELPWRTAMLNRIMLRKTLVELYAADIKDTSRYQSLIANAQIYLRAVRDGPTPTIPPPGSPGALAFDPHITRRLNSFVPLKSLTLPPQEQTWDALDGLLRGFEELSRLSTVDYLYTWKIAGNLRATSHVPNQRLPFLRSSAQSTFYDGNRIINEYPVRWVVERFFQETLGLSYSTITSTMMERWTGDKPLSMRDIEQKLKLTLINDVRCNWANPPRRARHQSKSLVDWHSIYNDLSSLTADLAVTDDDEIAMLSAVPKAALIWRLSTIREVVFSGFQIELYIADERPFAYWYAAQVMSKHISLLEEVTALASDDDVVSNELAFEKSFLAALVDMCTGMFAMTIPSINYTRERLELNFRKRYKWAFRPEYQHIRTPPIMHPNLDEFLSACATTLEDATFSPAQHFVNARQRFSQITDATDGMAGRWRLERLQFVAQLSEMASRLSEVAPADIVGVASFDQTRLDWNATQHRWFPGVRHCGKETV
ncbi:Mak10-domain-containing protein [Dentipellis sp. KUC8613]|nr:Mak10-domain-containing protein [Dentipellis sp. KUC8613]